MFSSQLLSLEPTSRLFQGPARHCPEQGSIIPLPGEPPPMPLSPCVFPSWGPRLPTLPVPVQAREGGAGARGASVAGSLQERRGSGASRSWELS